MDNNLSLHIILEDGSASQEIAFPQLQLCRRRYGLLLAECLVEGQEGKYRRLDFPSHAR
jgi:hypothetical protein